MNTQSEPQIEVGVMSAAELRFCFDGQYKCNINNKKYAGEHHVKIENGRLLFDDEEFSETIFSPADSSATFSLHDVCIGIGFHWEQRETQRFTGQLKIICENDKLWAINRLSIEDYLFCVIASEMSATSSLELLKAHAVVSRSWLIAQLDKTKKVSSAGYTSQQITENERIRWYDREDHTLFDVCADDHCQRYQGLTRATSQAVRDAIDATRGQLLTYNSEVCDARFSKCCGGVTERFESCWENIQHPYLQVFTDNDKKPEGYNLDLTQEDNARQWIETEPVAFCNTNNKVILRQVLNSYDRTTSDFYRWKVVYDVEQLSELVRRKTGIDFGKITNMTPIERGASGRIVKLRIDGTARSLIIGKELEIRRALSESHLYSSAFTITWSADRQHVTLHGAGWGHGVGMCQIGAAMMSERGYTYIEILNHYFRGAEIEKRW